MRPSETMQRGRRSPASSVDEREAEANRKLALEVLTRRKPATGLPAVPRGLLTAEADGSLRERELRLKGFPHGCPVGCPLMARSNLAVM